MEAAPAETPPQVMKEQVTREKKHSKPHTAAPLVASSLASSSESLMALPMAPLMAPLMATSKAPAKKARVRKPGGEPRRILAKITKEDIILPEEIRKQESLHCRYKREAARKKRVATEMVKVKLTLLTPETSTPKTQTPSPVTPAKTIPTPTTPTIPACNVLMPESLRAQ